MEPLVLVPGVQGRWEWMRRTVDALSVHFRVVTFSLRGNSIDEYADQVARALDERKIDRAIVCGVSFGGRVALRFAAAAPERTSALVLVSTPGPGFHLRPRHLTYTRWPRVFGPLFLAEAPWRLRAELLSALPDRRARWAFRLEALRTLMTAPPPLTAMAARARMIDPVSAKADCDRVTAPTLVVTGEPHMDHVVSGTSSDYIRLIAGARSAVLERTGHLGTMTRPDAFAALVHDFVRHARRQPPIDAAQGGLEPVDKPDQVA
jgi:pimeloyl-ACP methyl ester carboxylesterase